MNEPVMPIVNDLNRPFWDAGEQGRFVVPWCPSTQRYFWPPSPFSPFDTGIKSSWRPAPATGRLTACVTYRRAFQKAFEPVLPYRIGLVALDAGPRLQACLSPLEVSLAPRVGDQVRLVFGAILPQGPAVLLAVAGDEG